MIVVVVATVFMTLVASGLVYWKLENAPVTVVTFITLFSVALWIELAVLVK